MWWWCGFESSLLLCSSVCHLLTTFKGFKSHRRWPGFHCRGNVIPRPSHYLSLLSSPFTISLNNFQNTFSQINSWVKRGTAAQQLIKTDTSVWILSWFQFCTHIYLDEDWKWWQLWVNSRSQQSDDDNVKGRDLMFISLSFRSLSFPKPKTVGNWLISCCQQNWFTSLFTEYFMAWTLP